MRSPQMARDKLGFLFLSTITVFPGENILPSGINTPSLSSPRSEMETKLQEAVIIVILIIVIIIIIVIINYKDHS